ncbi:MAG TPA: twin-arginine translocase TatA/TatE family subunit [Candidatus Limnocylindria bacterium]|nr:twin-arginine translocase TatA/TatE family subunit [Candidatus Limnocylindria bacterium]
MFGIGTGEIVLLLVIALIVLGPERMPKLARDLGRAMAEFRRTSDQLRSEFLNADKYLDVAANAAPPEQPAIAATATPPEPAVTEAAVATDVPLEPDETVFDKEAREARDRLRDPERMERAKAEGWATPSDEAGTSERWG